MAQMMLVVVWAICFAFVYWQCFWGGQCASVDGGGGCMGWESFVVMGVIWSWEFSLEFKGPVQETAKDQRPDWTVTD